MVPVRSPLGEKKNILAIWLSKATGEILAPRGSVVPDPQDVTHQFGKVLKPWLHALRQIADVAEGEEPRDDGRGDEEEAEHAHHQAERDNVQDRAGDSENLGWMGKCMTHYEIFLNL